MRPPVLTDTGRCYPANMQKLPTGYSGNFNSRHADKTFPCLWETEKALVTPHMIWGDQIAAGSGRGQALLSPFKADALPFPLHLSGVQAFPRPHAPRLAPMLIDRQEVNAGRARPRFREGTRDKIAGIALAGEVRTTDAFFLRNREEIATFFLPVIFQISCSGTREGPFPFAGFLFVQNGLALRSGRPGAYALNQSTNIFGTVGDRTSADFDRVGKLTRFHPQIPARPAYRDEGKNLVQPQEPRFRKGNS